MVNGDKYGVSAGYGSWVSAADWVKEHGRQLKDGDKIYSSKFGKEVTIGATSITQAEANKVFDKDYNARENSLNDKLKARGLEGTFNDNQKAAIIDFVYNGARNFDNVLDAYQTGYAGTKGNDAIERLILTYRNQATKNEWGITDRRVSEDLLFKYGKVIYRGQGQKIIENSDLKSKIKSNGKQSKQIALDPTSAVNGLVKAIDNYYKTLDANNKER